MQSCASLLKKYGKERMTKTQTHAGKWQCKCSDSGTVLKEQGKFRLFTSQRGEVHEQTKNRKKSVMVKVALVRVEETEFKQKGKGQSMRLLKSKGQKTSKKQIQAFLYSKIQNSESELIFGTPCLFSLAHRKTKSKSPKILSKNLQFKWFHST